jgi:hypothetical protein
LPQTVDSEKVNATGKDGVLTVTVREGNASSYYLGLPPVSTARPLGNQDAQAGM